MARSASRVFRVTALGTGLVAGVLFSVKAQQSGKANQAKPNIVFIMSDDHAYQAISAYDTSLIRTPNIDRIARNGALMKQAYVTNSVCSPSRAVILTGKYSHVNGLRDNGTFFNGAQETLPKILQRNGYHTAMIGKWHLWSEPTGFDYWNVLPDQGHYYGPVFKKMGKDTTYTGYVTDIITDEGINWIKQNKNGPFCLMLQHKAPHRNFMPPIKYLDTLNKRQYPLPANFYDDYKYRKALQRQHITVKEDLDIRYDSKIPCDTCAINPINNWAPGEYQKELSGLSPEQRRQWDAAYQREYEKFKKLKAKNEIVEFQFQRYMEDYLRCIVSVDDNIGRVLKYLEEAGLAENTIVVYMSDQGFYLGEHGLYDKRFMYTESFRTPMMISYPKLIKPGTQPRDFVLNLDIAPTLLDLAGVKVPADMQGRSMRPLLANGKAKDWRKEIYYHYYERSFGLTPHFGIMNKRYKLIHFYEYMDTWELYDLKKDPSEMHNIYSDPANKNLIKRLKINLLSLQKQYGDPQKD